MRPMILLTVLLPGLALAQQAPVPPVVPPTHVCVPLALLDGIAARDARRPWAEVASSMAALLEVARAPVPCTPPEPPPPAPAGK